MTIFGKARQSYTVKLRVYSDSIYIIHDNLRTSLFHHFWSFCCQLYVYLSQNCGSDGHFEVLNRSISYLVQKLCHKYKKGKNKQRKCKKHEKHYTNECFFTKSQKSRNRNICVLCHNFWPNYNLDLLSTSKWPSEPQFCERYVCRWQKFG